MRAGVDTGRGYGTARGNRNSPNKGAGTKKLNQRAKDQKPKVNKVPTDNFHDEEESLFLFSETSNKSFRLSKFVHLFIDY